MAHKLAEVRNAMNKEMGSRPTSFPLDEYLQAADITGRANHDAQLIESTTMVRVVDISIPLHIMPDRCFSGVMISFSTLERVYAHTSILL